MSRFAILFCTSPLVGVGLAISATIMESIVCLWNGLAPANHACRLPPMLAAYGKRDECLPQPNGEIMHSMLRFIAAFLFVWTLSAFTNSARAEVMISVPDFPVSIEKSAGG